MLMKSADGKGKRLALPEDLQKPSLSTSAKDHAEKHVAAYDI